MTKSKPLHSVDRHARIVGSAVAASGNPDQQLSTSEAAELLGVHIQTLYNWRREGIGPRFHKLHGHLVRYTRASITEWLEERSHLRIDEYETRKQSRPSPGRPKTPKEPTGASR